MTPRFSSESDQQPPGLPRQGSAALADAIPECLPPADSEAPTGMALDSVAAGLIAAAGADDVFIPEHYEPNYAYPLLVWLTRAALPAGRLDRMMRMISDRNYIGVAVPVADPEQIEQQLCETFARLRRSYHIHTERVYLLGFEDAGTLALQTGLARPAWFGGIAALSSRWPETPRLLARFNELRGKRVLLGIDENDEAPVVTDALYARQLLWSAGMNVTALAASADSSPGSDSCRSLLREIDRWIMQGIEHAELVC